MGTPLGKPRRWSAAQLRALSLVTPADIIAAAQLWKRTAPPKYRRLLEAKPIKKGKADA